MIDQFVPYSQLRTPGRANLADVLPLAMPFALHIETTNRCNFKCVMCPLSFPDWEETVGGIVTMSLADHHKILADLDELGGGTKLRALKLYSEGEPLIDPNIAEKVKASRSFAERIEITSNASGLTEQKARALIDSGLDYLRISIYSIDSVRHQQVTGSRIHPETIRENIERFRKLRDYGGRVGPFLYVKMIDTGTEENQRFLDLYRPIADEVIIEKPMNWNSYEERDLMGPMYVGIDRGSIKTLDGNRRRVCAFPFYSLVIKANGDVVACCVDWNKNTSVGNIHRNSFGEIWDGANLREFRRMHLEGRRHENPSCRSCTYLSTLPDNLDDLAPEKRQAILAPDYMAHP